AFCQAVAALDRFDRASLYWAGRLTMVARKQDFDAYEAAFRAWFPAERDRATDLIAEWASQMRPPEAEAAGVELLLEEGFAEEGWTPAAPAEQDADADDSEAIIGVVASAAEVLHAKAFEDLTEAERLQANQLIRALALRLPNKRTRRRRPSPHGAQFDFRRTVRASLRTQGEPFRRAWRDRRERPRPLVLILDVSGSMSSYSRALTQFGFAAIRAGKRVEVFCFGTRLTRLTRALRRSEPDEALRQVAATVVDWDGGTRIGASLKELLDRWSQHASMRGAVVVLCSDGLERGDPRLLADQMARLSRLSHRLIWLNPLKGSPRYQPLARGMAAALPHVDLFLPGHNLASLEALCQVLEAQR
ncbi:MAG TPA: VWA domain-containing protein, partial [Actinomycetota bacterium]